jgi:Putative prokaryotic signal transducing protein
MKKIYSARNEAELAVVRSILESEGISYYVHNEAFGSLVVGPRIDKYNTKSIMVADESAEQALEIVKQFDAAGPSDDHERTSLRDRLRMILEATLFAWIVPGRSKRKAKE